MAQVVETPVDGAQVLGARRRRAGFVRPAGRGRSGAASWWRGAAWVGVGLLSGTGWGVVARAWMRYVSDNPEFTWSGTLFILGLTTLAGLSLGLVEMLRRRGVGGWRAVLALPALVMFAGPGIFMGPSAVLGGLAVSGRGGWWVRGPAAVLALAPVVALVLVEGVEAFPHSAVLSVSWYVVLCAGLAVGWSTVFRRPMVPGA